MIIGRDLLQDLGILSNFKDHTMTWEKVSLLMRDHNTLIEEIYVVHESEILYEATERTKWILEATYEPVTPQEIINCCDHLSSEESKNCLSFLQSLEIFFDGSLGTCKGENLNIEVKEGAKP